MVPPAPCIHRECCFPGAVLQFIPFLYPKSLELGDAPFGMFEILWTLAVVRALGLISELGKGQQCLRGSPKSSHSCCDASRWSSQFPWGEGLGDGTHPTSRCWDKDSSPSQGIQFPCGWLNEEGKTPSQLLRGSCGAALSPPWNSQVSDFQIFPDFPTSGAAFRAWDGAQGTPELCMCPVGSEPLKREKNSFLTPRCLQILRGRNLDLGRRG